jgi:hypothetical protein
MKVMQVQSHFDYICGYAKRSSKVAFILRTNSDVQILDINIQKNPQPSNACLQLLSINYIYI